MISIFKKVSSSYEYGERDYYSYNAEKGKCLNKPKNKLRKRRKIIYEMF